MTTRRGVFGTLTALAVLAFAPGAAFSSDNETRGPEGLERERVYSVPVSSSAGPGFEVRRIFFDLGDQVVGVDAQDGVVRESQDRIRLRSVPIIGQVFPDRLSEADFGPDKSVGDVLVHDRTLVVLLDPADRGLWFHTVVLVHDKFSYRFQGSLSGISEGEVPRGSPVGSAYPRGDSILILIRPSIITDSLF